jgi:hypothetical protein
MGMSTIEHEKEILFLIENRNKVPREFWVTAENNRQVIWFLNGEDGTAGSYETSQHRFGITSEGEIIWGFSSGCSCWTGWSADELNVIPTYKEFLVQNIDFVPEGVSECYDNLHDYILLITEDIKPLDVLRAKNAEVRRYLMKRVSYENIKNNAQTKVLHTDGTSELLEINNERYVKVKDSSTNREYLLYVPNHIKNCKQGIAWTFDLREEEYNPVEET